MARITGSVGKGGKNQPDDVRTVQTLLNKHASAVGYSKLKVSDTCDKDTLKAIETFQRAMGVKNPDGRVDPGGKTLKALESSQSPQAGGDKEAPGEKGGSGGAAKPGKVSGDLSGVQKDIVEFVTAVAAHYGRDIRISSGKRDAKGQGQAMFNNWTGNLKRGKIYAYLKGNPKLLDELDDLYDTAQGGGSGAADAKTRFIKLCAEAAPKLSLHVAGKAIDVSPKSCMTGAMRDAMKTGLRELEEASCYHYDTKGSAPAVTDALKKSWKAP